MTGHEAIAHLEAAKAHADDGPCPGNEGLTRGQAWTILVGAVKNRGVDPVDSGIEAWIVEAFPADDVTRQAVAGARRPSCWDCMEAK